MSARDGNRRVVITGYGALCSLGENSGEIWGAIMRKEVGYRIHELNDKSVTARFFGFMTDDKARYKGFPKSILKMLPRFAKNALVASREAVGMAFGHEADMKPT